MQKFDNLARQNFMLHISKILPYGSCNGLHVMDFLLWMIDPLLVQLCLQKGDENH